MTPGTPRDTRPDTLFPGATLFRYWRSRSRRWPGSSAASAGRERRGRRRRCRGSRPLLFLPSWRSALVRRQHALGEDEAAVEPPLAAGDNEVGALGVPVEGHALDRHHRPGLAFGAVDLRLHFLIPRRQPRRHAHSLPPRAPPPPTR